jgi:predicted transcriptional regulator of viral defense system
MTPAEITAATGMKPNNIKQLVFKMAKAGELHRVGKGRYWVDSVPPDNSDNPITMGENGYHDND